jgi:hypothetical protein
MKKQLSIFLAIAMLLTMTSSILAADLQQVTYSSGFQVQNLSATEAASISITYYPQTGTEVTVNDSIAAGGSVTYVTIHSEAGTTFNGSVVVSSNTEIAAIANTLGNFPAYAAATGGFSAGSTSFALPLVMCNNSGFDTWFNVQNAGSGDASIIITYNPDLTQSTGITGPVTDLATIQEGRALTFNQAQGSSGSEKKCGGDLGTKFVGAASISSDQPIVATVMQINGSGFNVLMGYNGFTGGAADVRAPLIMQNNSGFYTGIQVQNAGSAATNVTIAYAPDVSGTGTVMASNNFSLDPGASNTILHGGTEKYIGAATITSDNGQPLVAIVNQVLPGAVSFGTAYEAFDASAATANVSVPLIMANNSGFYTGVQVQNVGSSAVNVTITFGPNGVAGGNSAAPITFSLDPGASQTYIQAGNDGTNDWAAIGRYIGSATITANGNIVAIVNEANLGLGGDQFYTFDAFNY